MNPLLEGFSIEIFAWGGIRDKIWRCLKLAKKCKKRGLKWLSCTSFGEKLAKYVLIVNYYIDYYQKVREARQKL